MDADDILEVTADGETLARCSLWWSHTPQLHNRRVGYIGHYTRKDERSAQHLLERARRALASAGCATAIGPVDGTTWHRYRFVTERGDRAQFFLEPENPPEYPHDFISAGFWPIAEYVSAEETQLDRSDPRVTRASQRLASAGVRTRPLDLERFNEELDAIYGVACRAFAGAFLYSHISRAEFGALYEPLRQHLDPDFIRIAEHDGRVVGFAFGVPDVTAVQRGEPIDTIVGKTQAVLPELRYAGLGAIMLDDVRRAGYRRGMQRIIHALIRDDNPALNGSRRVAMPIRTYTLYESLLK
jgi:GNAT superfamily N-acetyltransferase